MSTTSTFDTLLRHVESALVDTSKYEKPQECPICYESSEWLRALDCCGHWVGEQCLQDYFLQSGMLRCPTCRTEVDLPADDVDLIVHRFVLEDLDDEVVQGQHWFTYEVFEQNPDEAAADVRAAMLFYPDSLSEREQRHQRRNIMRSEAARFVYDRRQEGMQNSMGNMRSSTRRIKDNLVYVGLLMFNRE